MYTKEVIDGKFELSCSDDVEFVIGYTEKNSDKSSCCVKANGMNLMALATTVVASVCRTMKEEPYLQATFLKAMIDTLKHANAFDESIDMAVSYKGKVLRTPKEKTADYSQ